MRRSINLQKLIQYLSFQSLSRYSYFLCSVVIIIIYVFFTFNLFFPLFSFQSHMNRDHADDTKAIVQYSISVKVIIFILNMDNCLKKFLCALFFLSPSVTLLLFYFYNHIDCKDFGSLWLTDRLNKGRTFFRWTLLICWMLTVLVST